MTEFRTRKDKTVYPINSTEKKYRKEYQNVRIEIADEFDTRGIEDFATDVESEFNDIQYPAKRYIKLIQVAPMLSYDRDTGIYGKAYPPHTIVISMHNKHGDILTHEEIGQTLRHEIAHLEWYHSKELQKKYPDEEIYAIKMEDVK